MSGSSPSQPPPATTITDLDEDSIAYCAGHLNFRDVSNLAMTCTSLKRLVYTDSVWLCLFRERWHQEVPSSLLSSSRARDLYMAQRTALKQFKFNDPLVVDVHDRAVGINFNHLGSHLNRIDLDKYRKRTEGAVNLLVDHKSRITCMRLFLLNEISSSRGETEKEQNLLVTSSFDHTIRVWRKVRIWDTAKSSGASGARSSCCVGMTSVTGTPVNMKCHESLLYVAAGSSVTAVDLRTMENVITAAVDQPKLYSFDIIPSKSLICTGGDGSAMLWDIRRNQKVSKPEPVAELYGHGGPVKLLHMDPYKTVTGNPMDSFVNVWETDTGVHANSLPCFDEVNDLRFYCDAIAVDEYRIVTAASSIEGGVLRFRDFKNASSPVANVENSPTSKFWDSVSVDDSN